MERFIHVPDTWEGWATRIITVAIALLFLAVAVLIGQINSLEDYLVESRQQRTAFQAEETARQCLALALLGSSQAELRKYRC